MITKSTLFLLQDCPRTIIRTFFLLSNSVFASSSLPYFLLLVPCGRLSWLHARFYATKYRPIISYRNVDLVLAAFSGFREFKEL